jgi:HNH endonuclease
MRERNCIIPLGRRGRYEMIVSQRHYAALTKWRWNWKMSAWKYGAKVYARRGGGRKPDGTLYPTIYAATYILRDLMGQEQPSPSHTPHHKDGNSLNNTDGNLCWATKSEQSAEQKPRLQKEMRAAIDEARIAA